MSPILTFFISFIEARYPGSKAVIDILTQYISGPILESLIAQAMLDVQKGMSFTDILKDLAKPYLPAGVTL